MGNRFYLRRTTIKFKLLSITILLILCSVLLVSILSYSQYTKDLEAQTARATRQTAEQAAYNLGTYLDELFRLANAPYYNEDLMRVLSEASPDSELGKLEKRREIEEYLNGMMITPRKDIISAYIISDEIYHGGRYYVSTDDQTPPSSYGWYRQAVESDKPVFVPAHTEQLILSPRFRVFSVAKRINKLTNAAEYVGVIKVDANYSGIEAILRRVSMGADGGVFIIDRSGTAVYASRTDADPVLLFQTLQSGAVAEQTAVINGKPYLLTATPVPPADWTILTMNSLEELNAGAQQVRNFTFLMAFICSLFAIIILYIFTSEFLRPLTSIIQLMKEVRKGNLTVTFPERREDEIGELGSTFNSMIQRINGMVREVYEAKLLQNEAQINAFYSQIRPHFLFNTLNMISLMIRCGKSEDAAENLEQLSDLLRAMVHLDKEITLGEEISLLRAYLHIQSSRYQSRLSYTIDISKEWYDYRIPALLFQPVVENAVIHGCEQKMGETHISIQAGLCGQGLLFTVSDNAEGMDAETLERVRAKLSSENPVLTEKEASSRSGVGLVNVNRRIKIKFGEEYGLTVDSKPGEGTLIRLLLPKPE